MHEQQYKANAGTTELPFKIIKFTDGSMPNELLVSIFTH
jgi:ABC-type metal ion transport system substrate-binding protein